MNRIIPIPLDVLGEGLKQYADPASPAFVQKKPEVRIIDKGLQTARFNRALEFAYDDNEFAEAISALEHGDPAALKSISNQILARGIKMELVDRPIDGGDEHIIVDQIILVHRDVQTLLRDCNLLKRPHING